MNPKRLEELLLDVRKGRVSIQEGLRRLKLLPFEDIGEAVIDHHRSLRKGISEVIFGEGKDPQQVITIMEKMIKQGENVLITRLAADKAVTITSRFPDACYYPRARALTLERGGTETAGKGPIVVISAGTSDIPVAEEAAITARFMGNEVETIFDVGVSGVHRLFAFQSALEAAGVIIVVAGMEGALPSVVGGLVDKPVIAVPTSVGYGASFGGLAALLGMLNSCASNVVVVNIDNGFSAGYVAGLINRRGVS